MKVTITEEQQRARDEYLEYLSSGRKMFRISDLLKMKPVFQRPLSRKQVAEIIKEWRVHRFDDPLVCICSDGTHLLDDGQHRVAAAAVKMGETAELLCRVAYTDLPGEEFVALNNSRRAVTPFFKHVARLSDGNETAAQIEELVKSHGFTIGRGHGPRVIGGINTLQELYKRDSGTLSRTLRVLNQVITARGNEVGWAKSNVIQSVWYVLRHYDCNEATMVRAFSRVVPTTIAPRTGNELSSNAPDIIIAYNKNLRAANRLNIADKIR